MKTNKLLYVLSSGLIVLVLAFAGFTSAKADNNNGNDQGDNGLHLGKIELKQDHTTMDVHVTQDGNVKVSGAKVTAVSGGSVSATTSFGPLALSWTVNPMANTHFTRSKGGTSSISEISVGDIISFQGMIASGSTSSAITVNATAIKDFSLIAATKVRTTINGTIKSVTSTTLPTAVVVTSEDKDYTVNVAADATVVNSLWVRTPISSFKVGDKVQAFGTVNITASTMDATVIRDSSL